MHTVDTRYIYSNVLPDLELFGVDFEFCPTSCPFREAQFPYAEDQLVINPNHANSYIYVNTLITIMHSLDAAVTLEYVRLSFSVHLSSLLLQFLFLSVFSSSPPVSQHQLWQQLHKDLQCLPSFLLG